MSFKKLLCPSPLRLVLLWGLATGGLQAAALAASSVNGQSQDVIHRDGFENQQPVVVIINEVDADTLGTDTSEFVEIYDGGTGNTALDGLSLVFYNGNGDVSYGAFDLDGFVTDSNGYFIVGNAAVPGVDIVLQNSYLQNGADAVALYQEDATRFPIGTPITTSNLVDALVYDTNQLDDAGLLVLLNPGQPQVNEGGGGDVTAHSNQRCPNGSGGALNSDGYEQRSPTPNRFNDC